MDTYSNLRKKKAHWKCEWVPNISRTVDAGIDRSPSIRPTTRKTPKSMLYRKACRLRRANDIDNDINIDNANDVDDVDGDINGDMHSG